MDTTVELMARPDAEVLQLRSNNLHYKVVIIIFIFMAVVGSLLLSRPQSRSAGFTTLTSAELVTMLNKKYRRFYSL